MVLTHIQFHTPKSEQSTFLQNQQQQNDNLFSTNHKSVPNTQKITNNLNKIFNIFIVINITIVVYITYNLYTQNMWLTDYNVDYLTSHTTQQTLQRALYQQQKPAQIIGLQNLQQFKQLPFCLIIKPNNHSQFNIIQIIKSFKYLQYYNYIVITNISQIQHQQYDRQSAVRTVQYYLQNQQSQLDLDLDKKKNITQQQRIQIQSKIYQNVKYTHKTYLSAIQKQCQQNSLVMFVSTPLLPTALKHLNQIHQKYDVWLTYQHRSLQGLNKSVQIFSFYIKIFEFLKINDFYGSNQKYINNKSQQIHKYITTIGLIQLTAQHGWEINKYFVVNTQQMSFLSINCYRQQGCFNSYKYTRIPYKKITKWTQNHWFDINKYQQKKYTYNTTKQLTKKKQAQLSLRHMLTAIQRQQIPYLPQQHSITRIQQIQTIKKYNIDKYTTKQKQLPFCITVLTHNNIQNNRYRNLVLTLLQQKYQNYRIIFIDDNSNDLTTRQTMKLLNQHQFPLQLQLQQQRIKFIKNRNRKYATYNIINSNYNYCKQQQIQMLIDGDDQLIGRYVLNIFNSIYQQNTNLWLVYSNYKDSYFGYGRSAKITKQQQHYNFIKKQRQYNLTVGAIRTWRVKVLYNIPIKYHKKQDGKWLDTVYDDALAHPILELSTVKRVKYIPQILYEYNVQYGDNDDSTHERFQYRRKVYQWVQHMPRLQTIQSLQNSLKDQQIVDVFKQDYRIEYEEIDPLYQL